MSKSKEEEILEYVIKLIDKRVWILLKACLNALIMKRKRLEVTHERYRKNRKID